MRRHGLYLNHVEHFPKLHGGTLRWRMSRYEDPLADRAGYLADERAAGLDRFEYYARFAERVEGVASALRTLIAGLVAGGATVAGYGAAAKGATMLNCVGPGHRPGGLRRRPKPATSRGGTCREPTSRSSTRRPDGTPARLPPAPGVELRRRDHRATGRVCWRPGARFIVPVPEPRVVLMTRAATGGAVPRLRGTGLELFHAQDGDAHQQLSAGRRRGRGARASPRGRCGSACARAAGSSPTPHSTHRGRVLGALRGDPGVLPPLPGVRPRISPPTG